MSNVQNGERRSIRIGTATVVAGFQVLPGQVLVSYRLGGGLRPRPGDPLVTAAGQQFTVTDVRDSDHIPGMIVLVVK